MARPFRPEVLVLGLSLIAVGVAWLLGNAGRIDLLAALHAWWPLTLVVWGVLELVAVVLGREARRSSR
jgi:membrane protein implicated in regulation of membrane protease activity